MVRVIQECVQLDAILLPDEYIEYCFMGEECVPTSLEADNIHFFEKVKGEGRN